MSSVMHFCPKLTQSLFALVLVSSLNLAAAADAGTSSGVIRLSSSASIEVTKDLLSVSFNTMREGTEAAAVQQQLKQALDAALSEAQKAASPGQLEVRTGNFSLSPRYTNAGRVAGWQGSAELVVEGRDMKAIGELSGRIKTLTIGHLDYGLSRELREKSEGDVLAQAIARYRAKAADSARLFGYTSYAVHEVSLTSGEPVGRSGPKGAMVMTAASADEALPVEAGKATVTVNVSGTVQMLK